MGQMISSGSEKFLWGGGVGVVDEVGGHSERSLNWGEAGVIKECFHKHVEIEGG